MITGSSRSGYTNCRKSLMAWYVFRPYVSLIAYSQHHDYKIKSHNCSQHAIVEWLAASGLQPCDIRSRPFRLHLRDPAERIFSDKTVWRSQYRCTGKCQRGFDEEPNSEWTPGDELGLAVRKSQMEHARKKINMRKRGCTADSEEDEGKESLDNQPDCQARLYVSFCLTTNGTTDCQVTITVKQVISGQVTLTLKKDEEHKPVTAVKYLSLSPTVRDLLHTAALRMGMTAGRLKTCQYSFQSPLWYY
jgi:hypothetical protein